MAKFSHERQNPEFIKQRALERAAETIKQKLSQEEFKITPRIEELFKEKIKDIMQKVGTEVAENELMKLVLEKLYFDQGGLPERLKNKYLNIVAEEVFNEVAAGKDMHKALGAKIVELRRRGLEIDGQKVEEKVREKI